MHIKTRANLFIFKIKFDFVEFLTKKNMLSHLRQLASFFFIYSEFKC